jgi:uncharacterized membrane protein
MEQGNEEQIGMRDKERDLQINVNEMRRSCMTHDVIADDSVGYCYVNKLVSAAINTQTEPIILG